MMLRQRLPTIGSNPSTGHRARSGDPSSGESIANQGWRVDSWILKGVRSVTPPKWMGLMHRPAAWLPRAKTKVWRRVRAKTGAEAPVGLG